MLYQFLLNFVDTFGFLNVFKYLTFRTGLSVFTSFVIVLIIGGPFIKFFSNQKILNPIRDDGPVEHIVKKIGTPTMGGVIILLGLLISVLCWGNLSNINILFCLYIAISFGLLGAFDDYKKIRYYLENSDTIKIIKIIKDKLDDNLKDFPLILKEDYLETHSNFIHNKLSNLILRSV